MVALRFSCLNVRRKTIWNQQLITFYFVIEKKPHHNFMVNKKQQQQKQRVVRNKKKNWTQSFYELIQRTEGRKQIQHLGRTVRLFTCNCQLSLNVQNVVYSEAVELYWGRWRQTGFAFVLVPCARCVALHFGKNLLFSFVFAYKSHAHEYTNKPFVKHTSTGEKNDFSFSFYFFRLLLRI